MKISILGAGGFLGQNLARRLVRDGHQVVGYVLNPPGIDVGFECQSVLSLLKVSSIRTPNFDVTINLAARRSTKSAPLSDSQVDKFTYQIPKEFLLKTGLENTLVINMSTYIQNYAGESGRTVDSYGAAKEKLSQFLESHSKVREFKVRDLYFFTLYGIGDRPNHLVPLLLNAARSGDIIELSPGHQLMNLLYVDDAVQNIVNYISLKDDALYRKSYVWEENYLSVKDLVNRIESVIGRQIICSWGAREYAGHEMMNPWYIPMQQLTSFVTTTKLEEGISKVWDFYYNTIK